MKTEELTAKLTEDAKPVQPIRSEWATFGLWMIFAYSFFAMALSFNEGDFIGKLRVFVTTPHLLLEFIIGAIASILVTWSAAILSIPSERSQDRFLHVLGPVIFAGLMILMAIVSVFGEAMHPQGNGVTACIWQVIGLSIPAAILFGKLMSRGFSPYPLLQNILIGLSASIPVGLYMNIACHSNETHALVFHLLPCIGIAAVWGLIRLKEQR